MPVLEILFAVGAAMALAADTLTVVAWLAKMLRRLKRWWKKHKRE